MSYIKGSETIISMDDKPVLKADSISIEISDGTEEVTNLDSGNWKEFKKTLKEWSGSFEAKMYVSSGTTGHTYYALVEDIISGNNEYTLTVKPQGDGGENKELVGDIIITKVPYENNREGYNTYSVDFQGTGALELVDIA